MSKHGSWLLIGGACACSGMYFNDIKRRAKSYSLRITTTSENLCKAGDTEKLHEYKVHMK